jgi:hypothetical protein
MGSKIPNASGDRFQKKSGAKKAKQPTREKRKTQTPKNMPPIDPPTTKPAPVAGTPPPASKGPQTSAEIEASLDKQRRLTERLQSQKEGAIKPGNSEIDTKLTDGAHVGQHPSQPIKDDAMEARKVGDYERIGMKPGAELETTALAPKGAKEPTDEVPLQKGEDEEDATERLKRNASPGATADASLGAPGEGSDEEKDEAHPGDGDKPPGATGEPEASGHETDPK